MPPNKDYACLYDSKFVDVLVRYHLSIDSSDKQTMSKRLASC